MEVFGTSGFKDFNGWVNTFGNIMYIYSPLIPQKDFTYISICVCMYVNIFDLISWPYKMHWTHCHIDLFTTCRVSKNRIHTFVHHFSPVTWSTAGIMHLTCAIFCDTAALITWSLSFFRKPSLRGAWLSSFFMVDDCWLSCFKDPSRFLVICHPGMAAVSDFIKFIKDHKTLKKNLVLDR